MSYNLRTSGGGLPAIPILKSVIGTAATQNDPLWLEPCFFLLRFCLFVTR